MPYANKKYPDFQMYAWRTYDEWLAHVKGGRNFSKGNRATYSGWCRALLGADGVIRIGWPGWVQVPLEGGGTTYKVSDKMPDTSVIAEVRPNNTLVLRSTSHSISRPLASTTDTYDRLFGYLLGMYPDRNGNWSCRGQPFHAGMVIDLGTRRALTTCPGVVETLDAEGSRALTRRIRHLGKVLRTTVAFGDAETFGHQTYTGQDALSALVEALTGGGVTQLFPFIRANGRNYWGKSTPRQLFDKAWPTLLRRHRKDLLVAFGAMTLRKDYTAKPVDRWAARKVNWKPKAPVPQDQAA